MGVWENGGRGIAELCTCDSGWKDGGVHCDLSSVFQCIFTDVWKYSLLKSNGGRQVVNGEVQAFLVYKGSCMLVRGLVTFFI